MATIQGFMNIYRSGYFHRKGKPGTCDRHAGDLYLSEEAAKADIDPPSHYICTVPVTWEDHADLQCNPVGSVPTPLHISRREVAA